MKIEELNVRNFRSFRDARMRNIPPLCVVVGANGSGKSTLFDVFSFLRDSLQLNVSKAIQKRGGFREVMSRESDGPIKIEVKFREHGGRLATYSLEIGEECGSAIVLRELLHFRTGQRGRPWHLLDFSRGQGHAIVNEADIDKPNAKERRRKEALESPDLLAIKGLGQFKAFKLISEFRRLVENWHISNIQINDARISQEDGIAEHVSSRGENLALVAQHLKQYHPEILATVLEKMARRVPGIAHVEPCGMDDGRVVLRFKDGSFKDPFVARHVSDGTIKMFAYLLLLHDPNPFPLLAIEEPENQLYPSLMDSLAEEFQDYADRGGQVFVSTHSTELLNAVELPNIFWLEKHQGYSTIHHAADDEQLKSLVAEGDRPGALWRQQLFGNAHPAE
jgi:predicted ATPase